MTTMGSESGMSAGQPLEQELERLQAELQKKDAALLTAGALGKQLVDRESVLRAELKTARSSTQNAQQELKQFWSRNTQLLDQARRGRGSGKGSGKGKGGVCGLCGSGWFVGSGWFCWHHGPRTSTQPRRLARIRRMPLRVPPAAPPIRGVRSAAAFGAPVGEHGHQPRAVRSRARR